MTFDPLRCAEATCQAAVVLGATVLPAAWRALDGDLAAVLAAAFVIVTGAIYALHAVTFDLFRLTRILNSGAGSPVPPVDDGPSPPGGDGICSD